MVNPVFHKTEAGQDEIRTRARKLDQKLRAVLLVINGERRQAEILAQVGGLGVGQEALDSLVQLGLIQAGEDDALAPPAPALAASTITPSRPTAPQADAPGTSRFKDVYHFFTTVIGEHLGLRGYLMQMKVEKAGTLAELLELREPLHAALKKAKGDVGAVAILDQLDDLLEAAARNPA